MKQFILLNFKIVLSLVLSFFMGVMLATAVGAPDYAVSATGTGFAILSLIPKGMNLKGSLAVITITDLLTEYGTYYKAGSQSLKDVLNKLFQPSVTEAFFTGRKTDSTRLELANATISRVLQSYQSAFTPIGDTAFTPQPLNLDHMKIDAKILPHDLMESWLGFLAENALKPAETPLVKYWLEQLVIPQFQEDLELFEIFMGKKVAIVPGTAGVASTAMNGIKEKLKGAGVNVVTMGAAPTTALLFHNYVEDFAKNINPLARLKIDAIAMNPNLALLFRQGKREKYNMYYAQDTDLNKLADYNIKIQELPSMGTHTSIWATPKDNRIIANKNPKNQGVFDIQVENRDVKVLTDFHKGVGFWSNKLVWRSDVTLV